MDRQADDPGRISLSNAYVDRSTCRAATRTFYRDPLNEELGMHPVTLTGGKVTLREFCHEDASAALRILGDDTVTRWLSFDSRDLDTVTAIINGTIERAKQQPRMEYYLAVTLPDNDLIGFARLGLGGVQAAKLGYAIRADQWGHGYATDAANAMIDFGFQQLRLHRITAAIDPDNEASIALVKRLGFHNEGRLRDHVHTNGTWRDSLLYAILNPGQRHTLRP